MRLTKLKDNELVAMESMPVLYDHRGNPSRSKQLTREISAPSLTGIRTVWDSTVAGGLTPFKLASLLQGAASGAAPGRGVRRCQ